MTTEDLRKRKKELGLSNEELAKRAGLARSTVARMMSPTPSPNNVTVVTFKAVARALGLSDGEEAPAMSLLGQRLLAAFEKLDGRTQALCVAMVERFAEMAEK